MKAIITWIESRTGLGTAAGHCIHQRVEGGAGLRFVLPALLAFGFVVQAITGFFLWMVYSASAQTAWESVYYIQHELLGGWLLRGLHHYTAQVMVALAGIYLLQLLVTRAYRAPREVIFWLAVLILLTILGLCLTGDLLRWDQRGYWSTVVRTNFLNLVPVIGGDLFQLAVGGPAFGHHTVTRFLSLHIGLCGA
ncbi:MAG: cytochrome b N-terminal domain-containing protein, partial [Planctomycetes bacterium]|nr:cytochrome b N-terminal domain-containing protein [Planctomycetota bacterium]